MGKLPQGFDTWIAANKKANTVSKPIRTVSAQPTLKAGPKNSNGPKGGSAKTGVKVPNNSRKGEVKLGTPRKVDNRGKNAMNTSKTIGTVGKVSKTTHADRHTGRNTKNVGFSKRVNHSLLKRAK